MAIVVPRSCCRRGRVSGPSFAPSSGLALYTGVMHDTPRAPADAIRGYHAHIYYDADTRSAADRLRKWIAQHFPDARIGRWHDIPIGPHTQPFYQVAFAPGLFSDIVPWLVINHGDLPVLVHPETGADLTDHTTHALWLGEQLAIDEDELSR